MQYYTPKQQTEQLKGLLDRLNHLSERNYEGSFKSPDSSFIELKNASLLDFTAVRKYEMRDNLHRELKASKSIKINSNNELIFNIHNSQIAGLFWFNDRNDALIKRMSFNMMRYLEFQGNKQFMLSFSDSEMDQIYNDRGYQYLMSVSDTMSVDFCSRKLLLVRKKFSDLGTRQKFSSWKTELTLSVPRMATKRAKMSKIKLIAIEQEKEENFSTYVNNLDKKMEVDDHSMYKQSPKLQTISRELPHVKQLAKDSVTSKTSSEGIAELSARYVVVDTMMQIADSKKQTDGDEDIEKYFEFVFDILGHYFGIEDKISTGCNVGMIVKDWSYPVDCICLIGDKGIYIKTNYMIRYEKDTKTLVNLMGWPNARNYNQGKYYMDLEQMTNPFDRDFLTMNKFRKQQGDSLDKMYSILYQDITEIHSKHYMGKRAIGLEFWTVHRRPRLFIFNIYQIDTIWPIIVENWTKVNNNSREILKELEKSLMPRLGYKIFFLIKMVEEISGQSRLTIKYFDDQSLTTKMKRKWEHGFLDNFNYLMILNACAGRSLKFMSCYYIFPQVIKCYSGYLRNKEASMRDLARPMPVTRLDSADHFANMKIKYECEKFHHGNFYSNKNILEHYLFRVMPYTQYQYDLNDGKLDDRMFFDFESNFRYCSGNGSSFEMIPENYYLDYYLLNLNNLDFRNEKYDNVDMPEWSNLNPRQFNIVMRQALESSYVNRGLGKWIDLIFGSAQQGPKAIERLNLYMTGCSVSIDPAKNVLPNSTSNIDSLRIKKQLNAQINMQFNMGQTPAVLFTEDHPEKRISFDPERTSAIHAITTKNDPVIPLATYDTSEIEEMNIQYKNRLKNFSQLTINDSEFKTFGPVGFLLKKLRTIKNRYHLFIQQTEDQRTERYGI